MVWDSECIAILQILELDLEHISFSFIGIWMKLIC